MSLLREYTAGLGQPTLTQAGGGMPATRYDEVIGPDGALRQPWKGLAEVATRIEVDDLRRVAGDIERFLDDDAVTYARPGQAPRRWQLDPVPIIIDAAAWKDVEVGLVQRAELLDAVLADLYGEQRLLTEGIVPPAVVFGHRGFARVMARATAGQSPLLLSATDLGRGPDGTWHALADRTQAPSGLGYAVENRRVLSRVLPDLYREADLHRISPYLWALRSAVLQAAAEGISDPRVVVLSPGSHSETHYDQAAIATHLGLPLVQGEDLIVREGWVVMDTPGWSDQRVDVIVRRVDAAWCDPLELRGDSELGVAGLSEAVRRDRVRVVNGLGAGVLENPGLFPYLPAACERLLGESLRLPSVPTWWCGEADSLHFVLDHLDELIVRSIDGSDPTVAGASPERTRLALTARPHAFVAHERLLLSQAPTWQNRSVQPAEIAVRTFTLRLGSSYRPMMGGLATVRAGEQSLGSKDVWVLKEEAGQPDQGLPEVAHTTSMRALPTAVPRVLDDLFWAGRYAERSEAALRLVLATDVLVSDRRIRAGSAEAAGLEVLLGLLHRLAGAWSERSGTHGDDLRSVLLDDDRSGSAAHALRGLREALTGVRDQLSPDIWRAMGSVERAAAGLREGDHRLQVTESAGQMLTGVLALQGVTSGMIRDAGWHMSEAGRFLERGLQVTHLVRLLGERRSVDVDREVLGAVLDAAESALTHRRRYRDYVRPVGVVDLLLTDLENPRSLAFAMQTVREHLAAQPASTGSTRPERLLADLIDDVAAIEVTALVTTDAKSRPELLAVLDSVSDQLERLAEALGVLHFATGPRPRAFGALAVVKEGRR
ncbi:MAG: circularly permuted type 2 ATP-grasp protein [Nocardioidaceae bacterium]|nr:circularly permuted type 2 ATP-grasp protein [Nocardioidaceae bacterium]